MAELSKLLDDEETLGGVHELAGTSKTQGHLSSTKKALIIILTKRYVHKKKIVSKNLY